MIDSGKHPDPPLSTVSIRMPSCPTFRLGELPAASHRATLGCPRGGDGATARHARADQAQHPGAGDAMSRSMRSRTQTLRWPSPVKGEAPDRCGWPPGTRHLAPSASCPRRIGYKSASLVDSRACCAWSVERRKSSSDTPAQIRVSLPAPSEIARSSRRLPADQRALYSPFLLQDLDFPDQFANSHAGWRESSWLATGSFLRSFRPASIPARARSHHFSSF